MPNPRKYRNTPVMVGMVRFDSKAEARRFLELQTLAKAKQIQDLKRQITFALYGKNGNPVCRYRADFMYVENEKIVIEDVKSKPTMTPEFRIKRKLFADNYPNIEFRIVGV